MDEPTVAVDPQSRNKILEGILQLAQEGATIVYTTHYMEEAERICSRIMIMDRGKAVACGTREELKTMIRAGEKLTVETEELPDNLLESIRELEDVLEAAVSYTHLDVYKRQIRDREIRLIGENGEQLGIISARDALKQAQDAGLDLVKIAPTAKPPVCKIIDYSKDVYKRQGRYSR